MKKTALLLSAVCLTLFACEQQSSRTERTEQERAEDETSPDGATGTTRGMTSSNDEDSDTDNKDSDKDANDSDQSDDDQDLRQRIKQVLANDSNLAPSARRIDISVNNGRVTLQGTVRSEREKILIANKIRQLSGINGIENQIDVAADSNMNSGARRYY
jgi:hypothetical protein